MTIEKQTTVTTSLRLPSEMSLKIKDLAQKDDRSFNWMVVYLLDKGIKEATRKRQSASNE